MRAILTGKSPSCLKEKRPRRARSSTKGAAKELLIQRSLSSRVLRASSRPSRSLQLLRRLTLLGVRLGGAAGGVDLFGFLQHVGGDRCGLSVGAGGGEEDRVPPRRNVRRVLEVAVAGAVDADPVRLARLQLDRQRAGGLSRVVGDLPRDLRKRLAAAGPRPASV